ncbi:MAG: UDP-glucose 4-epimerase GalE, partial [Acidobacteria bacterium]|nr:UDP-glucose 4-epimerase GalE [Acidobacteriota bacterium]
FPLHVADLRDIQKLADLFEHLRPTAVIHFAAHCYVGESVTNPRKYFEDNLRAGLNLLGAMLDSGCRTIVFSSSCATYGEPEQVPIPESHRQQPVNPYGETKLFLEKILHRYGEAYGIRSASLRYFNAAGADPSGRLGESHEPETHLIPLMVRAILDPGYTLTVFGDDYPTPDGTCIRDYIHVLDLGQAHLLAMEYLLQEQRSLQLNLGTGSGFSVRQMIRHLERIAGSPVKHKIGSRRPGDPPRLVACADEARRRLGWECRWSAIDRILETAWRWHLNPRF